jgi:Acyl-CoA dehydrogenase, C-terminal domain
VKGFLCTDVPAEFGGVGGDFRHKAVLYEYLVCRMFADSRVQRIYGDTNEIMKEIISRAL